MPGSLKIFNLQETFPAAPNPPPVSLNSHPSSLIILSPLSSQVSALKSQPSSLILQPSSLSTLSPNNNNNQPIPKNTMAQLNQPESAGFDIGALAPAGTVVATCLEVQDQFRVERPKFENPAEQETLDVTRFLFGFKGPDGSPYKVQSFEFRISGSPKSNLFKFLTAWLGTPPKYGWDYCELKGQGAMITVAHKQSRDGTKTYANIVGISPVIDQLQAQVIPVAAFDAPPPAAAPSPAGVPAASAPAPAPAPTAPPANSWNPAVETQDNCPF